MNAWETTRSALRGMAANPLRSVLTLLGVLIGVGSVILLVGVGNGSAKAVTDQIGALGTTTITVRSSSGGGPSGAVRDQTLTLDTVAALEESIVTGGSPTSPRSCRR